jgi:putative hydrolase of the HAD superfamily
MDVAEFSKHYWAARGPYDAGITTGFEYWSEFAARAGCSMDEDKARELVDIDNASWAHENVPMTQFAHAARKAGFRIGLLSNMPADFRDYLPVGVNWLPVCDHRTLSCELKITKPDIGIYEHCLRGLRVSPDNALFIDDREVNIEAAEKLGIQCVHFRTTEQALEEVLRKTAVVLA